MERNLFFTLAQQSAVYTEEFKEFSKPTKSDLIVIYKNCKYYPEAVEIRYNNKGKVKNIAILHDIKSNTIVRADLERVEKYE